MTIEFSYDAETDLAIYILTGKITIEDWVEASQEGAFHPAFYAVVDLRCCDLGRIGSMGLHHLTRHLKSALAAGRMVPGKTAIITATDGPLIYHPTHRLFHTFANFVSEKNLPRQFKLFTSPQEALDWLGKQRIESRLARALLMAMPTQDADDAING